MDIQTTRRNMNNSEEATLQASSSSASHDETLQTSPSLRQGCGHFETVPIRIGSVCRPGSYELGYEVHAQKRGKPIIRVLGIMGFMNSMGGWERVMSHCFLDQDHDYEFLVFDNRGIGQSTQGTSFARFTTSSLAKDALAVLEDAGWTEERSVHLMGISMGGM
jgi:predicted alpha/beta-fold hydrolase